MATLTVFEQFNVFDCFCRWRFDARSPDRLVMISAGDKYVLEGSFSISPWKVSGIVNEFKVYSGDHKLFEITGLKKGFHHWYELSDSGEPLFPLYDVFLSGNDTLNGSIRWDNMIGGAGNDKIYGNAGNDDLFGDPGRDSIYGGPGNDDIYGDSIQDLAGGDRLYGGDGKDKLFGGYENDFLNGGAGNDELDGEYGDDRFIFNSALSSSNVDKILFFAIHDKICLDNSIFTSLNKGILDAAALRINYSGLSQDSSDRIIYEKDTGELLYDADGTGAATAISFAVVHPLSRFTIEDFIVF